MSEKFTHLIEIENKLQSLVGVSHEEVDECFAFSIAFARIFAADTTNYQIGNGVTGATRNNWTYHTAFAIVQTAKYLI